jgi:hypothetical protein
MVRMPPHLLSWVLPFPTIDLTWSEQAQNEVLGVTDAFATRPSRSEVGPTSDKFKFLYCELITLDSALVTYLEVSSVGTALPSGFRCHFISVHLYSQLVR